MRSGLQGAYTGTFAPGRRPWAKGLMLAAFPLLVLGAAVDAFWVEPYRLEVTRHRVDAPVAQPIKIAHVSDLHTSGLGRRERRLVAILEREKPDVIVITGDTLNTKNNYPGAVEVLSQLRAPVGVWIVRGNREAALPLKSCAGFTARPASSSC